MPFDPDKYLNTEPSFDPDAFLKGKKDEVKPPAPSAPKTEDKKIDLKKIGEAGLEQGLFGLAAPEATYALGKGLTAIPWAPAKMAGTALQVGAPFVGRIGPAISGAFGGLTGETLGQAAETSKYTKPLANTVRVLTGAAIPTALETGVKTLGKSLVGTTTATTERLAKLAEDLGFKLEPRQLRQDAPKGSPGFLGYKDSNQKLANELVSEKAGLKIPEGIDEKYIGQRLAEAGEDYNKIFGREFKIDRQLINDMNEMSEFERKVRPADVRSINDITKNITDKFSEAEKLSLGDIRRKGFQIEGKELQRLRSEISDIARNHQDGNVRFTAGNFLEKIDNNILRNHPYLAQKLQDTNRKYAVGKTLEDLNARGGIQQGNVSLEQLGDYLSKNIYGYGSGATKHPLYDLGLLGNELKIRGRFQGVEGAKPDEGLIGGTFNKLEQYLNLPSRLPLARALQRRGPVRPTVEPSTTSAITATEQEIERKREGR
jgi:hypothetical protein